jgi:X-Pro dipeptidyl-peptidase
MRRRVCATAAVIAAVAFPAAAQAGPPPWLEVEDGVTQPVFSLDDAVTETLFVETVVDSDQDGRRDLVRIHISRPGETETEDIDVPVVFEHSPYRGEFGDAENHPVDPDVLPQEHLRPGHGGDRTEARRGWGRSRLRADLPGRLDDRYVPRGYAVILGEGIGSAGSDGCPTIGDSDEALSTRAVIDWLNGRARAFTADGQPARADWTTGAVGMTGVSYDGTLPNMVATTGVRGLKTIVPISAISSWYDYYRANGLVVAPHSTTQGVGENFYLGEDTDVLARFTAGNERSAGSCAHVLQRLAEQQDRTTGDSNRFWRERDYLRRARDVRASVFLVHGLNDWNVKTKAFAAWWERLRVPRKLWLHNGGHGGPGEEAFDVTVNRWFDHWLFGVRNGILDEPRVKVQRPDDSYDESPTWPVPGARTARVRLGAGTLTTWRRPWGVPRQRFVDAGRERDTDDSLIQAPDAPDPNRLAYLSPVLRSPVHVSGTPEVTLRASVDNRNAANLTAVLVDYGPDAPTMITRGWMDVQNRRDLSRSTPIRQGREYDFSFDLQPDDYVVPAGHRIGLVVVSTDHDYTIRPLPGTRLTLAPARSELRLPVVGGRSALGF